MKLNQIKKKKATKIIKMRYRMSTHHSAIMKAPHNIAIMKATHHLAIMKDV